jgi:hypothetical protein
VSHPNAEAPKSSGLMEDLINIFVKPSAVFENQRNKSFVMPALVQSVIMIVLVLAMGNLIMPFFDAENARAMAAAAAKGQAIPPEAAAAAEKFSRYGAMGFMVLAPWFFAIFGGLLGWIGAKIVGAKMGYGQAATVASWSSFPNILGTVAMGVIGMMSDLTTVRGVADGQLGPARFLDPTTASPAILALLQTLEVFNIWSVVLFAIGVAVVGRVSMGSGMIASIVKWGIVALFAVGGAVVRG